MALTKITSDVIAAGAVESTHIASGAISSSHLSSITTDNVSEGSTNTYFTNARARSSVSVTGGGLSYDSGTGVIQIGSIPNASLTNSSLTVNSNSVSLGGSVTLDTDDIGEGSSNLYFTNARAQGAISGGTGVTVSSGAISIGQDVAASSTPTFGNITTTGYIAGPATFTIDPAAVGDNTGTVVIAGNLQVDGTTTTINSTTLTVDDLNITLASGAANAAAANGAGITVDGASATITYDGTNDEWDFNKDINVTGTATMDGITVDGASDLNGNVTIGTSLTTLLTGNDIDFQRAGDSYLSQTGGGSLFIRTNDGVSNKVRVNVSPIGDISFYEDTGSTAKFFWDASAEQLGVGTTSPGHPLNVVDSGELQAEFSGYSHASAANNSRAASGSIRLGNGAGTTGLLIDYTDQGQTVGLIKNEYVASSSSELRLQSPFVSFYTGTSASEAMRISHDGAVAIGTGGAPASGFILDVRGNVRIGNGSSTEQDIHFYNNNTEWQVGINNNGNGTDSNQFYFYEGGNYRLTVQKGGNVGIGTASPYHTFDVFGAVIANGAAKSNGLFFDTTSATTGTGGGIALGGYSNGTGGAIYHFGNIQGIKENSTAGNYASAMLFSTRANGATPTERMRIDSSGNVGIGEPNPDAPLHITSTTPIIVFDESDASQEYRIGSFGGAFALYDSTDAAYRLVVDGSGKVGIGTTLPGSQLEIRTDTSSSGYGSYPAITIRNDNAAGYGAIHFNEGSTQRARIEVGNNSGSPYLLMNTGTSSGNGIYIDSAGEVGIGTTNPTAGLEVYSKVCKFWHGNTTYYTMFEDQNEINTYTSAGANSTMYLQHAGGDLEVGAGILFVDRSASSVGIGTASPSTQLHVKGTNNSAGDLYTAVGPGNTPSITIQNAGTTNNNNAALFFRDDNGMRASVGARFVNHTTDETELRFSTTDGSGNTRERVTFKGTGGVGFGTSNPFSYGGGSFEFYDASSNQTGVRITSAASNFEIGTDSNGGYLQAITPGDGISFYSANSSAADIQAMRINESGIVTTPYNPAFRAYLSTEQTSNGEVTSGYTDNNTTASRAYDRTGHFNVSNGRFTAPVDGVYVFSVMWDSLSSQAGFNFLVNGTNYNVMWEPTGLSNDAWESKYYGTHLKLSTNDYVTLYIVHASGTNPVHQGSGVWGHFAGALIG